MPDPRREVLRAIIAGYWLAKNGDQIGTLFSDDLATLAREVAPIEELVERRVIRLLGGGYWVPVSSNRARRRTWARARGRLQKGVSSDPIGHPSPNRSQKGVKTDTLVDSPNLFTLGITKTVNANANGDDDDDEDGELFGIAVLERESSKRAVTPLTEDLDLGITAPEETFLQRLRRLAQQGPRKLYLEAAIEHVFLAWRVLFEKRSNTLLSRERRSKIKLALEVAHQVYGGVGEDLNIVLWALSGARADPWTRGRDARSVKPYDDLVTILRDWSQVERFAAMNGGKETTQVHPWLEEDDGALPDGIPDE